MTRLASHRLCFASDAPLWARVTAWAVFVEIFAALNTLSSPRTKVAVYHSLHASQLNPELGVTASASRNTLKAQRRQEMATLCVSTPCMHPLSQWIQERERRSKEDETRSLSQTQMYGFKHEVRPPSKHSPATHSQPQTFSCKLS